MAKAWREFKKYEESRKKTTRFLGNLHRKSVSDWKKASRQREVARNKRLREYKREKEKQVRAREKEREKNASAPREPMTFSEFLCGVGFMVAIVVMFILFFVIGFWKTILLGVGLFVAIIIISVKIDGVKEKRNSDMNKYLDAEAEDRCNQILYLRNLLEEIRKHQTIANTSNDPEEVKKHLDCLLAVMDKIATFDDATLKQAGMTKAHYESTKADILNVYDTMIAQAGESNDDDCIATPADESTS